MTSIRALFLIFVPTLMVAGCAHTNHTTADRAKPLIDVEPVNPWTHLDLRNDPQDVQFVIVTDRTGGHRPGVFPDAMRRLNLLQPEFVMSVGDLIEGYTEDRGQLEAEWDDFDGFLEALDMPFFYLPGNHDITNPVMADVWENRLGRSYYSFVYQDVLFVCMNSEDTQPSKISAEQTAWLEQTLADNADVRWTLVFVHKPLWVYTDAETGELQDTGWPQVEGLLRPRKHTVFAGHFHSYTKHVRNDSRYFVLATTGGGSGLMGPLYGQFDHVVWVTMTDAGPQIANLLLDGIWDEDIRTDEMARLVEPLLNGNAVVIDPILGDGEDFRGGNALVQLKNDADVPLHLTAQFFAHDLLIPSPAAIDIEIPPNSVELVTIDVTTSEARNIDALSPLQLDWRATYMQDEVQIPTIEGRSPFVVSRTYPLPRRETPAIIDGDFSDWGPLAFNIREPSEIDVDASSWMGPADCSWRFGVEIDDEYLYIAVDVTDERQIYLGAVAWAQDGIEVRVDGRPDPARSLGRDEHKVFVAISPGQTLDDMILGDRETMDQMGVRAIGIPTPTGHAYEMAIPLSYVVELQGPDWRQIRINIAVDDFDEETGPLAQLWWQPDWRDPTNYPASGTFERAAE